MQSRQSQLAKLSFITVFSLLLINCGQHKEINPRQFHNSAPQSQAETGQMVSNVSLEDLAGVLQDNPQSKIRIISKEHQVFEVLHLTADQLQKQLPRAQVTPNQFFRIFAENESLEELVPENCLLSAAAPQPKVEIIEPTQTVQSGVINLGENFVLDASSSLAHPRFPSSLKVAWAIIPPEGSLQKIELIQGAQLNYKPDSMGLYAILLIVQDSRNVCGMTEGAIIVTDNQPLKTEQNAKDLIALQQTDLSPFTHLKDMKVEASWLISQGESITIAIIDSGINYNHFALYDNVLINQKEIPDNQIDDDENGYVDDYLGYDFVNADPYPYDDQGHGTHVAGLAASSVFGVAKKAKILAIKALSPIGGDLASIVGAIYYATDRGAQIINMSFGNYGGLAPEVEQALDYAKSKGVLLVAAAGNGDPLLGQPVNIDDIPLYPASSPNENILVVTAKSNTDLLSSYSNFGQHTVDVVAPGGDTPDQLIQSTFFANPGKIDFVGMYGTSMATPLVAGVAAQILSINRSLKVSQVKEILMTSGQVVPELKTKVGSSRYLDALSALKQTRPTP